MEQIYADDKILKKVVRIDNPTRRGDVQAMVVKQMVNRNKAIAELKTIEYLIDCLLNAQEAKELP